MSSKNKFALVTGANRGIGKEIARQLVGLDFHVILTGRDLRKLNDAQKEIDPSLSKTFVFTLDVSVSEQIKKIADTILKITDHVDVLVNNAAVIGTSKGMIAMSEEEFENVIRTNSFGSLFLIRAIYPFLKKSSDAKIINLSSGMGALDDLSGNYAAYRLSKVFINSITILAAEELKKDNIKVYAMCPGWVKTGMGGKSATRSVEKGAETAVWLATGKNIAPGRFYRDRKEIPF